MNPYYYTQHRRRAAAPEHRVQVFLRGTGLIGTLKLDAGSGKVTCDLGGKSLDDEAVAAAVEMLGELWAWADGVAPQAGGPA